ncbi:diguanylate cyclase [Rhodoferax sp. 4810]|uniref:Diguanylate cyclase n=1 Tax=Thiospirillum jenense TaxID=1653858 RepID=A0A839HEJ6_9GAMM|nr:diguanylate cyclase [Thiospirillum jenense]MBB1074707.1 diguanylate cyclase [Rhodoferax jenense]MBB1125449.1 diguanylate cyclase [Thiospirillum jenense]
MQLDIYTLTVVLMVSNLLLVIALFLQYRIGRSCVGTGWWVLGTLAFSLGFAFTYLRAGPIKLLAISANNLLFFISLLLLYIGVLRFLNRRANLPLLLVSSIIYTSISLYFTYFDDSLFARRINISFGLALFCFLMTHALSVYKTRAIAEAARFLGFVFFSYGLFLLVRGISPLLGGPVGDLFTPSLVQVSTYLSSFIVSILWTFGFIVLINQRLQAENNEAHDNLKLIFNTSPNAFLITRYIDGKITLVNDGFSAMTGLSRTEVLGKTPLDLKLWDDPHDCHKVMALLATQGACNHIESKFCHQDGSRRIAAISAKIIQLQEMAHVISVVRDITQQKYAEQALRDSEEKYRILFMDSPDAYLMIQGGYFIDCNHTAEMMLGGQRDQIIGKMPAELSPEYQANGQLSVSLALEKLVEAQENGRNQFEWMHRRFDGQYIHVEVSLAIITLNGKKTFFTTWRDITDRKKLQAELQQQAMTDELTGAFNRRYFIYTAQAELKRAQRFQHGMTLALLDFDYFKQINDQYGHAAGDAALIQLTHTCQSIVRDVDVVARLGGDEFALLLPETNGEQGTQVVERIRIAMTTTPLQFNASSVTVTITGGVAELAHSLESLDELMHRADQALYQAKADGRNCVVVADMPVY